MLRPDQAFKDGINRHLLPHLQGADIISTPMFVDGDYGLLADAQQLEGDTMATLVAEIDRQLRLQAGKEANLLVMPTRSKL